MLDAAMLKILEGKLAKDGRFSAYDLQGFAGAYPAAWDILTGGDDIWMTMHSTAKLTALVRNFYRYAEGQAWQWVSGTGKPCWDKLLKVKVARVNYDCHSIADALAELAALLGFGKGQKNNVYTLEPPSRFPEGSVFVLPLNHPGATHSPLLMFNWETGDPACGGHQVWSDHQFMHYDNRVYDAMLNVAGITLNERENQYVEWYGVLERCDAAWGGYRWVPDRPGKPVIYRTPAGYTFQEIGVVPGSKTKQDLLGAPMAWSSNPLYKRPGATGGASSTAKGGSFKG